MKSYKNLNIQESIELSKDTKSKFLTYAIDRINNLLESNTMNYNAKRLFENKNRDQVTLLLSEMYNKHYTSNYDDFINSFDRFTMTINEQANLVDDIINQHAKLVNENVHFSGSHLILKNALEINPNKVLAYLINESINVSSLIDVTSILKTNLFESDGGYRINYVDANYDTINGLFETLKRTLTYCINGYSKHLDKELVEKASKLYESMNNIYSIYKEGMDLVKVQETQASDIFKSFIYDKLNTYNFSISRLDSTLTDPAGLVQICIHYLDIWVNTNQVKLSYKFRNDVFNRLESMKQIFDSKHVLMYFNDEDLQTIIAKSYWSQPKLYELLDLMLTISQMLRMDLKNLTCKYINTIRPMIQSYYNDWSRSTERTGY